MPSSLYTGNVSVVAIRDGTLRIGHRRVDDGADHAQILRRRDRHAHGASPMSTANFAASPAARNTPPCSTKRCKCASPDAPSSGRVSSVSSMIMFGVSAVFFHGTGLPTIGTPLRISDDAPACSGANRITSYFDLRLSSRATVCVLMYEVRHAELVERHAPPAFGLRFDPRVHQRDARRGELVRRHLGFRGDLPDVQARI